MELINFGNEFENEFVFKFQPDFPRKIAKIFQEFVDKNYKTFKQNGIKKVFDSFRDAVEDDGANAGQFYLPAILYFQKNIENIISDKTREKQEQIQLKTKFSKQQQQINQLQNQLEKLTQKKPNQQKIAEKLLKSQNIIEDLKKIETQKKRQENMKNKKIQEINQKIKSQQNEIKNIEKQYNEQKQKDLGLKREFIVFLQRKILKNIVMRSDAMISEEVQFFHIHDIQKYFDYITYINEDEEQGLIAFVGDFYLDEEYAQELREKGGFILSERVNNKKGGKIKEVDPQQYFLDNIFQQSVNSVQNIAILSDFFENINDNNDFQFDQSNCVLNYIQQQIQSFKKSKTKISNLQECFQNFQEIYKSFGQITLGQICEVFQKNQVNFYIYNIKMEEIKSEVFNNKQRNLYIIIYQQHLYFSDQKQQIKLLQNKIEFCNINIKNYETLDDLKENIREIAKQKVFACDFQNNKLFLSLQQKKGKKMQINQIFFNNQENFEINQLVYNYLQKYVCDAQQYDIYLEYLQKNVQINAYNAFKLLLKIEQIKIKKSFMPIDENNKNVQNLKIFMNQIGSEEIDQQFFGIDQNKQYSYCFQNLPCFYNCDICYEPINCENFIYYCEYKCPITLQKQNIYLPDYEIEEFKQVVCQNLEILQKIPCQKQENNVSVIIDRLYEICPQTPKFLINVFIGQMVKKAQYSQQQQYCKYELFFNKYDLSNCEFTNNSEKENNVQYLNCFDLFYVKQYNEKQQNQENEQFVNEISQNEQNQENNRIFQNMYNYLPIHWQITARSKLEVYKKFNIGKQNGLNLVFANTDSLVYRESQEQIQQVFGQFIGKKLGQFKISEIDSHQKQSNQKLQYKCLFYKIFDQSQILLKQQYAGNGKTFEIKQLIKENMKFGNLDDIVIVGQNSIKIEYILEKINCCVFQKFQLGKNFEISQQNIHIDEIFLCNYKIYHFIYIWLLNKKNIILYGDDQQLLDFNLKILEIKMTEQFKRLITKVEKPFTNYRNTFTKNQYDEILNTKNSDILWDYWKKTINYEYDLDCQQVSYKNENCWKNNCQILKKFMNVDELANGKINLSFEQFEHLKIKVICQTNDIYRSHGICNKHQFETDGIFESGKKKYICLFDKQLNFQTKINFNLFKSNFYYSYCVTIHQIQGQSCKIFCAEKEIKSIIQQEVKQSDINRIFYTIISRIKNI